jgi:hypothetical protein
MGDTWRYHANKPAIMVDMEDDPLLERLHAEGWRDTPAAFKDRTEDIQQDSDAWPDDGLGNVQRALLAAFNDDPDTLTKDEHIHLAEGLGIKLDRRSNQTTMITKIQEALTRGAEHGNHQATD